MYAFFLLFRHAALDFDGPGVEKCDKELIVDVLIFLFCIFPFIQWYGLMAVSGIQDKWPGAISPTGRKNVWRSSGLRGSPPHLLLC